MSHITIIAGWVAGILGFIAYIPYIISTVQKKTIPNRATWIIWTVVSTITAVSYVSSGATDTIWYPISNAIAPFIILMLAVKNGEGGWTMLDRTCLITAGLGLFLWWLTGIALIGLCVSLLADAMGAIPTIVKTYYRPESEDRLAWSMTFCAISINLIAVDWHSFANLIYPVYMFVFMGIITFLVWLRPRQN